MLPVTRFHRPAELSPEQRLRRRLILLLVLVLSVLAVLWWDREGLRDQIDGHVSFSDVAYFTAVTITTVGYGDIVPVSDRARLIDTIFVTPLRLVIWLMFLGTAYELILQRWLENRRMRHIQKSLQQHLIICGYGHSGRSAALEAHAKGTPAEQILVMEHDMRRIAAVTQDGFLALEGDPTRRDDLEAAGISRAKAVLVCLGRDDTAALAVLTVRQIHPKLRIVCNVAEEENASLLRQAGADALVLPAKVGGYLMADSLEFSHTADYVSDLMCVGGRIQLEQRSARPEEYGLAMREIQPGLAVRLIRNGLPVGFWEGEDALIRAGDHLLIIKPNVRSERDNTPA